MIENEFGSYTIISKVAGLSERLNTIEVSHAS
jgi:hypothetical protein